MCNFANESFAALERERGGGDPASPGAEERSPEQRESSNLLPRPGTQQTCPAPGTRFDQTCLTYLTYPVQCVEIIKFGTKCRQLRAAEGGYLLSGVSVLYMKCDLWHTVHCTVECGGCGGGGGGGGGVSPSSVSRTRGSVSPGPAPSLAALVEGGPGNHSCHVVTHCYYTGHSILSTCHL